MRSFVIHSTFAAEVFDQGLYPRLMGAANNLPKQLGFFNLDKSSNRYTLIAADGTLFYLGATVKDAIVKLELWNKE